MMQINLPVAFTAIKQWAIRPKAAGQSPSGPATLHAGLQADEFIRRHSPPSGVLAGSHTVPKRPRVILFSSSHLLDGVKVGHAAIQKRRSGKWVDSTVTMEKVQNDPDHPSASDYDRFNLYVKGDKVGYTELKPEKNHIWVQYMVSPGNTRYKSIGTALHQIAVEMSLDKGLKGKVALYSLSNAVGFHYKSGFRAETKATNRKIAKFVKEAEHSGEKQPCFEESLDMALTPGKIKTWKVRIRKSPILDLPKVHTVA